MALALWYFLTWVFVVALSVALSAGLLYGAVLLAHYAWVHG
jgi:hypothetical protein